MSRKQRKTVAGHFLAQDAAEYGNLLAVPQRELRGHYEVPEDFPTNLMMKLNDQEPVQSGS